MVWKSTRKGKHYQTKDSADNSNFRIDPRLVVKERTKKIRVVGRKSKPKHKEQIINPTEDKKLIKAVQNGAPIYKKDAITSIDSSNPKKIEKEFR